MKKLILFLALMMLPNSVLALEQTFTQQNLRVEIKLSPDTLAPQAPVQMTVGLSKDGVPLTDNRITLEVYERDSAQPVFSRTMDVLDGEYLDSWKFEKPGEYKVVLKINPPESDQEIQYELNANVVEPKTQQHGEHSGHNFVTHHFGKGHWGWWGAGMMLLMIPMMILL